MTSNAWQNLKSNWQYDAGTQMASLSVLAATFVVLSLAFLAHQNIEGILAGWGNEVKVSVYLNDGASKEETNQIENTIQESGLFSNIDFLSKNAAAERFKKRVGQIVPDLLSDMDFDNPLPASYELKVNKGVQSTSDYQGVVRFAAKLKSQAGVEDVSYGQGWVENYAAVISVFSYSSAFFSIVLLCGGLFVIGNSIRNSLIQRKEEIEILELFGATKKEIMWPYLFEGFVTGFVAAVIALVMTYAVFVWQQSLFERELSFWFMRLKLEFLTVTRMGLLLTLGATLGCIGAWVWVRKVNSGWSAAEASSR